MRHLIRKAFVLLLVSFFVDACAPVQPRIPAGVIPHPGPMSTEEMQIGLQARAELLSQVPLLYDRVREQRVANILSRLFAVTPSQEHWKVYLLDSPVWNAATIPGNMVFVFRGIMDDLRDDDELAAVLAHEIGHRLARHHVPSDEEQLGRLLTVLAGVGVAAALDHHGASQEEVESLAGLTAEVSKGFLVNPYSQSKELEADQIGIFLMADAGFSPQKAPLIWSKQAQQSPGSSDFFNTHPASEKRHHFLMTLLPQAQGRYQAAITRKAAPRARVTKRAVSYQPSPQSWAAYMGAETYFNQYRYAEAAQALSRLVASDRNYVDPRVLLGVVQAKHGDVLTAERTLREAVKVGPTHALAHYNLACAYSLRGNTEQALQSLKNALDLDPTLAGTASNDPDFFVLRQNPRFTTLLSRTGGATFQVNLP